MHNNLCDNLADDDLAVGDNCESQTCANGYTRGVDVDERSGKAHR